MDHCGMVIISHAKTNFNVAICNESEKTRFLALICFYRAVVDLSRFWLWLSM